MSAGAEELIRELCDALNAGEIERAADLTHPDVVQYGTRGGIDQDRVFRGRQAVLEYWDEVGEAWASLSYEPERILESGDMVVVFWHETARSARADLEVQTSTAAICRIKDGKIAELRGYMDRDEALRAAGVEE
jgi:ketosteroid isomerase-like protein